MADERLVRCFVAGKVFSEGVQDLIDMLTKYVETDGRIVHTLDFYARDVINVPKEFPREDVYINLAKDKFHSVLFMIAKCSDTDTRRISEHPLIREIEVALERKEVKPALERLIWLQANQDRVLSEIMR